MKLTAGGQLLTTVPTTGQHILPWRGIWVVLREALGAEQLSVRVSESYPHLVV
jgi:hypothetical protein